jgi:hypothetical protein
MVYFLLWFGLSLNVAQRSRPDTIQAGNPAVSAKRLRDFSLTRLLTLTKGDSARPFGRQLESLSHATLWDDAPALLDVQVFDTPNGKTVDSSWVDDQTLRPLRSRSHNASRVVRLDFATGLVRSGTTPATGTATRNDQLLPVQPFEWNVFGLAVAGLPLHPGYRVVMPVYSERSGRVAWYTVEVVGDTTLSSSAGPVEPAWEVLAKSDSTVLMARFWVAQRQRVVTRVLVSEPGISILYARP